MAAPRRRLLVAGAGLVVVVGALAFTQLTGGGGGDPDVSLPEAPSAPAPAVAAAEVGTGHDLPAVHADNFETAQLRDPFCPLVVSAAPGAAPVVCPEQAPAAPGGPMALLDVFLDEGVPHARARVGPKVFTLHVGDRFDAYTVTSLAGTCGVFDNGAARRTVCEQQDWAAGTPV